MWQQLLRCESDVNCYMCLPSSPLDVWFRRSANSNAQRHNQLVLLAGTRHGHAERSQLVQVTMRFALAHWRDVKELSQVCECLERYALTCNTYRASWSLGNGVAFLWGKARSWSLTAVFVMRFRMSTAVLPVHMCLRDVDRVNLLVPLHASGQLATAGFACCECDGISNV